MRARLSFPTLYIKPYVLGVPFRADHTLIETITNGGNSTSSTGTWSMTASTVTITLSGHPPMAGTVYNSDHDLVYTMMMPKSDHQQIIKRVWTYSKA